MKVGVIADTHGLLRAGVLEAFAGVEHILHAGDVGDAAILTALRGVAPVTAIRGNVDRSGVCSELPPEDYVELGGMGVYLVHDVHDLSLDPVATGVRVVVSGHTHKPLIEERQGVLFFNPGAAGPRRFALPMMVGLLWIDGDGVQAEHVALA